MTETESLQRLLVTCWRVTPLRVDLEMHHVALVVVGRLFCYSNAAHVLDGLGVQSGKAFPDQLALSLDFSVPYAAHETGICVALLW